MNGDAAAKNEQLFRKVNEQIETVSQEVPATDLTMDFLCECDDVDCHATVNATRAEYESVRAVSTHFIVVPGHVDPAVEHVVLSNERFLVVEKEGEAAERADVTDPRSSG
jgi:hypothetical protein